MKDALSFEHKVRFRLKNVAGYFLYTIKNI